VIRLEPMDEATYQAWREASIRDYASEKVEAGNWLAAEALERATADFRELLPDGRATVGHELRAMKTPDDVQVGHAWFAFEERPFGRVVFIYDIAVDPAHRRQGHAQAALAGIEAFAREHGCVGVQLHVFGGNEGARALYRRAGYVETNVTMLKRIDD
jgi:ribosomal protein S18 acetylase RimI-like enzyme